LFCKKINEEEKCSSIDKKVHYDLKRQKGKNELICNLHQNQAYPRIRSMLFSELLENVSLISMKNPEKICVNSLILYS